MSTTKTPTTIDERIATLAEKTKAQLVAAVIDLEHHIAEIDSIPISPPASITEAEVASLRDNLAEARQALIEERNGCKRLQTRLEEATAPFTVKIPRAGLYTIHGRKAEEFRETVGKSS